LLPTLKERKRYILVKIYSKSEFEKKDVKEQCTNACLQFLGELGMAKAGIQFLAETWNKKSQTGILRAGHIFVDEVKSSLALISKIKGKKATAQAIKVSGSMDKLKKYQKEVK